MANILVIDSDGLVKEIKATGVGSTADPFVLERFSLDMDLQIARGSYNG